MEQASLIISVLTICLSTGIAIVMSTRYIVGTLTGIKSEIELIKFGNQTRDDKIDALERIVSDTEKRYNKDLEILRDEINRMRKDI